MVRPLDQLRSTDLPIAGGKGAQLGELIHGGFSVPDGFVVTTAAYDAFVTRPDVSDRLASSLATDAPQSVAALFADADLPGDLAAEIDQAYAGLGGGPVAVRSSATAEDLPGASFAGQQDTYLNVTGTTELLAAIRRCWASLWNARAVAYRERAEHDPAARLSIAVVVQRLVPAEVAGVMFTANPANGRREQTVITAAWGLGEAVVGGLVESDEYLVDRADSGLGRRRIASKQVMTIGVPGGSGQVPTPAAKVDAATLTEEQVHRLADLGGRIEEHFGVPQDIEWALLDDRFEVLQARPITALPEPVGDVPAEWPLPRAHSLYFRASIVEQLPDPLTPLFADLIRVAVPAGLDELLGGFGPALSGLDMDFPTINGYAYYDYPRATMGRLMLLTPLALGVVLRSDFVLDRWRDRALPAYRDAVARWSDRDAAGLPAAEQLTAARELLVAACTYYSNVQMVIPVAASSELTWTGLYDRLLRRDGDPQASDFLLGFDSTPLRAEKSLYALAGWCRTAPGSRRRSRPSHRPGCSPASRRVSVARSGRSSPGGCGRISATSATPSTTWTSPTRCPPTTRPRCWRRSSTRSRAAARTPAGGSVRRPSAGSGSPATCWIGSTRSGAGWRGQPCGTPRSGRRAARTPSPPWDSPGRRCAGYCSTWVDGWRARARSRTPKTSSGSPRPRWNRPPRRSTPGRRASPTTARRSSGGAGNGGDAGSRRPRSTCRSRAG